MTSHDPKPLSELRPARPRRTKAIALALGVLVLGAAGGAGATHFIQKGRAQSVLLLEPAPISAMKIGDAVAVKGAVAEIYGNKFIVQDGSGRTLVDAGPRDENGDLVSKGETLTIQGDYDGGFIRAIALKRADGTLITLGAPPHPHPDKPGGPGPLGECGH
jgi:hypothetical protein